MSVLSSLGARVVAKLLLLGCCVGLVSCAERQRKKELATAAAQPTDETVYFARALHECFEQNDAYGCSRVGWHYRDEDKAAATRAATATMETEKQAAAEARQNIKKELCRTYRKECLLGDSERCAALTNSCDLPEAEAKKITEALLLQGCEELKRRTACESFMRQSRAAPWAKEPETLERQRRVEEIACQVEAIAVCLNAAERELRHGSLERAESLIKDLKCKPAHMSECDAEAGFTLQLLGRETYGLTELTGTPKKRIVEAQTFIAELLMRGCSAGSGSACATLLYKVQRAPRPPRVKAALAGFVALCDKAEVSACLEAAQILIREASVRDLPRSASLFLRHCPHAHCTASAGELLLVSGAPADAEPLLRKGCEAGLGASCAQLGAALLKLSPPRATEALELLERGCTAAEGLACFELAKELARGRALRRDAARAELLLRRACSLGTAEACPAHGRSPSDFKEQLRIAARLLAMPAKLLGTAAVGAVFLPFCLAGTKEDLCPVSWWK